MEVESPRSVQEFEAQVDSDTQDKLPFPKEEHASIAGESWDPLSDLVDWLPDNHPKS